MEFVVTEEQAAILRAGLSQQCVIACAGSGKTATAVRRLLGIREQLAGKRGYVALLSYSNVAVDTFRKEYRRLSSSTADLSPRVLICTVDAFITSHILLPHAASSMGCARQPFLVQGSEAFLKGFTVSNGSFPVSILQLQVTIDKAFKLTYSLRSGKAATPLDAGTATRAITKLGKTGAYTFNLARYWALRTLADQERLANVLARRYPHILVDEAQDIGSMHGALLSIVQDAGSKMSLIGDPNQSIYEFADADGSFLRGFATDNGIAIHPLSQNRRSVREIVSVSNQLTESKSTAIRAAPTRKHGAFFFKYSSEGMDKVLEAFMAVLASNQYDKSQAAILCRGSAMVDRLSGGGNATGQGATEKFACAAVCRDRQGDIGDAFEFAVDGALKLLHDPPQTLRRDVLTGSSDLAAKSFRRVVWQFLRDSAIGLPAANLPAKSVWQPALKTRVPTLLTALGTQSGVTPSATWMNTLTVKDLGDAPLWHGDMLTQSVAGVRVCTVHQAKGEGIDAVLYVTKPSDLKNLLAGPTTEEGRIGYVAVTRARDLVMLAVPESAGPATIKRLEEVGFLEWPATTPVHA